MTSEELYALVAAGESLTVEFKSDRGPLSDTDLVEAVVCLANAQGGTLLLDDRQSARALGLVKPVNGHVVPTVAGLLLVGPEQVLRDILPAHEAAFRVLEGQKVRGYKKSAHYVLSGSQKA